MWNGTMFVDLDWPLNASSPLLASAELLVYTVYIPLCVVKLTKRCNKIPSSVTDRNPSSSWRSRWR